MNVYHKLFNQNPNEIFKSNESVKKDLPSNEPSVNPEVNEENAKSYLPGIDFSKIQLER